MVCFHTAEFGQVLVISFQKNTKSGNHVKPKPSDTVCKNPEYENSTGEINWKKGEMRL